MVAALLSRLDLRTRRMLAVGAAAYLGRLGGALAVLIYVPMAREVLDAERFGVWMWLSALLGLLAFADLGVGYALLNRVTAVLAGDPRQRPQVLAAELMAAYACTLVLGLALVLGWWLWCNVSADAASLVGAVSPAHRDDVIAAISAFVLLFALNLPAGLIQKMQLGAQDGHWVGVAQFVASALTLLALPLALSLGAGLAVLVAAVLGVQCVVNLASSVWWLQRQGVLQRLRPAALQGDRVRLLLRQGVLFFGLQGAAALAFQSDVVVISQVLGPAAYGDFSVVQRLFLLVGAGLAAGISGLWPAFGDAIARGELRWVRRALINGLLLMAVVSTAACTVLVLAMDLLSVRWLQAAAPPVLALTLSLACWTVVEALGSVSGACLNGANILRLQLAIASVMATVAFAGKWWAVHHWGMPGVVWATLAAYLLIAVPGQVFIFRRLFNPPVHSA